MAQMNQYPSVDDQQEFDSSEKAAFLQSAKVIATGSKTQGGTAITANIPIGELAPEPVIADDDTIVNDNGVISVSMPVPSTSGQSGGEVLTYTGVREEIEWRDPLIPLSGRGISVGSGGEGGYEVSIDTSKATAGDMLTYGSEGIVWDIPPIGIPDPSDVPDGAVLTVRDGQAVWEVPGGNA